MSATHDPSPALIAWAARYNVPLADAKGLGRLIRKRARLALGCREHSVAEVANQYGSQCDDVDDKLDALATQYGFTVDYGAGPSPVLMRGRENAIVVPD